MRTRKKPWAESEFASNEKWIRKPDDFQGRWHGYFQNSNPIHIEIGCGKGGFIKELALRNPHINYIAVEKEEMVAVMALRLFRESGNPSNLALIIGDVKELGAYFAPGEIQRIYINFCDPWHRKKKWAKRRLTHHHFLHLYDSLFEQGDIHFKTDNQMLFEFSLNELAGLGWHMRNITLDLHHSEFEGNTMTEYETKFNQMGMPIYRLEASPPGKCGWLAPSETAE